MNAPQLHVALSPCIANVLEIEGTPELARALRFKRAISTDDLIAIVLLISHKEHPLATHPHEYDCSHHEDIPVIRGERQIFKEAELEEARCSYQQGHVRQEFDNVECYARKVHQIVIHDLSRSQDVILWWSGFTLNVEVEGRVNQALPISKDIHSLASECLMLLNSLALNLTIDWANCVLPRYLLWSKSVESQYYCFTGCRFGVPSALYSDHPHLCHSSYMLLPSHATNWNDVCSLLRIASNAKKVNGLGYKHLFFSAWQS